MKVDVLESIDAIPAAEWNALEAGGNPFLRHEFLAALEHHGCVGATFGWHPRHLVLRSADGRLLGASPLYRKDNSYGEFVFDHAWADALERAGRRYYPKLVCAVPYTPATGPRLLLAPGVDPAAVRTGLIEAACGLAAREGASSLHWLFPTAEEAAALEGAGMLARTDIQYHWHNRGWRDFEDFLGALTASRRKKIRQDRRRALAHGLDLEWIRGDRSSPEQRAAAAHCYRATFDRKWGVATLNRGFFDEIAGTMGRHLHLVLARDEDGYVAAAILFEGGNTLYGRHWGAVASYPGLHFELCYHLGIDYCIEHGLQRFEPGAQGEHKIWRGFVPTLTRSAHWIADPAFRDLLRDHLALEREAVAERLTALRAHVPFRHDGG